MRTDAWRSLSRIRSTAPATSRFRRRARTPRSPLFSMMRRPSPAPAAHPSQPPSSPSTRFDSRRASPRDRHRRALVAARAQRSAGEWTRARGVLADLLAETRAGSLRAEALVLLAGLESERRSVPLLEEALREAASAPALQSVIHCRLAWAGSKPGFDHARRALELADELDDDQLRGRARAMLAILSWFAGEAEAPEDLPARVRDFPSAVGGELLVREATLAVVNTLAPVPKRDEARALLEHEYEEWRDRDEPRSSRALWGLAWVEFWAGRWALAAEYAARARDISVQYGLEMPQDHLPSCGHRRPSRATRPGARARGTWPPPR